MQINFNYDFSEFSQPEFNPSEIISVCENARTRWREIEGYPRKYMYSIGTGYSNQKRILQVALRIPDEKIQPVQAKIADEDDIDNYYCDS